MMVWTTERRRWLSRVMWCCGAPCGGVALLHYIFVAVGMSTCGFGGVLSRECVMTFGVGGMFAFSLAGLVFCIPAMAATAWGCTDDRIAELTAAIRAHREACWGNGRPVDVDAELYKVLED